MTAIPALKATRRWVCPNGCGAISITNRADVHTQMHTCSLLHGLLAPMVREGTSAKQVAVERGDYVGSEHVQTDGRGRPVMAVVTTRDDGEDCTIFAPLAVHEGRAR